MTDDQKPKLGSSEWLEEMQRLSRERAAAKAVYLPAWPELRRGSPNEIVRSALFTVRNRRTPRWDFRDEPIVVFGDGEITYRGEELRQDDHDVWLQLLHLARQQPLGEWVEFTAYSMLKALGWSNKGPNYQRLRTCLSRMKATALTIRSKRLGRGVMVSLVQKAEWQDEVGNRRTWRVWIDREVYKLFAEPYYTLLEWEQRKQLGPLAKWLHGFYASHAEPHPLKVETLQAASGSEMGRMRDFRQGLKQALDELKTVGFLKGWRIAKGLLYVERTQAIGGEGSVL
jgi:hypothetical protein